MNLGAREGEEHGTGAGARVVFLILGASMSICEETLVHSYMTGTFIPWTHAPGFDTETKKGESGLSSGYQIDPSLSIAFRCTTNTNNTSSKMQTEERVHLRYGNSYT